MAPGSMTYRYDRPFLSYGAQKLLWLLKPHNGKGGRGVFPKGWNHSKGRNSGETPATWLAESIKALDTDPDQCTIHDRIACFGVVQWNEANEITHLCLHAVVALDSSIEDLYCDPTLPCQYYRLEADRSQPGPLFKEPFPHIHVCLDGEPRFPFDGGTGGYAVQEFLEFLYRNHIHGEWKEWAQSVYEARACKSEDDLEAFDEISTCFDLGDLPRLIGRKAQLERLRTELAEEMREACDLHVSDADRSLIDYPLRVVL